MYVGNKNNVSWRKQNKPKGNKKKVEVTRLVRKFGTIDKICNRRCQRMVIMKRHGSIADQKMFQLVLSGHYLGESPGLAQGMGY